MEQIARDWLSARMHGGPHDSNDIQADQLKREIHFVRSNHLRMIWNVNNFISFLPLPSMSGSLFSL